MSSNPSARKTHGAVMGALAGDLRGWELAVECKRCCRSRTLPMSALPAGETVATGVYRLRCQTCRAWPSAVAACNCRLGWERRVIALVGPGDYG